MAALANPPSPNKALRRAYARYRKTAEFAGKGGKDHAYVRPTGDVPTMASKRLQLERRRQF